MNANPLSAIYPRLIRRVRAVLIDSVFVLCIVILWWATLPLFENADSYIKVALPLTLIFILEPCMVAFTGGTPGHHIMGIKIVSAGTGRYIGVLRALIRALFRGLFGWLSFVIALTSQKHQALHDLIVGTVVVLINPADHPTGEKQPTREINNLDYSYPSKLRRTLLIFLYNVGGFMLLAASSLLTLSDECIEYDKCTVTDEMISMVSGWCWFFYFGTTIVMCWRGQLPGCRRTRAQSETTS